MSAGIKRMLAEWAERKRCIDDEHDTASVVARIQERAAWLDRNFNERPDDTRWKPSEMTIIGYFVLLTGAHPEYALPFVEERLAA